MKIISISVVSREMKIKPKCARTTPSVKWLKLKWHTILNDTVNDEHLEKLEFSYIADGSITWYNHFRKQPEINRYPIYMKVEKILI